VIEVGPDSLHVDALCPNPPPLPRPQVFREFPTDRPYYRFQMDKLRVATLPADYVYPHEPPPELKTPGGNKSNVTHPHTIDAACSLIATTSGAADTTSTTPRLSFSSETPTAWRYAIDEHVEGEVNTRCSQWGGVLSNAAALTASGRDGVATGGKPRAYLKPTSSRISPCPTEKDSWIFSKSDIKIPEISGSRDTRRCTAESGAILNVLEDTHGSTTYSRELWKFLEAP